MAGGMDILDQGRRRELLIKELLQEDVRYQGMELPRGEEPQKQLL